MLDYGFLLVLDYYMTEMIVEPYSICIDNLFTGLELQGNGDIHQRGFYMFYGLLLYYLWISDP